MYFDALTLTAVADELQTTILGGRIQRVILLGPLSIGLEIYAQRQRHQLVASAHPQFARLHLVQAKLSRGMEQVSPLLLLLRKYVLGGRIIAIEQPLLERLVVFSIVKEAQSRKSAIPTPQDSPDEPIAEPVPSDTSDHGPEQPAAYAEPQPELRSELIVETMDRRSNILLVDDNNIILESVKRVTPQMSQRVILPRQPYELPPRQSKHNPHTATASGIAALPNLDQPDLARALVATYSGISPQAAREVVYRALGRTKVRTDEDVPWDVLAACLRELVAETSQPSLVMNENSPVAYAPYMLTHLSGGQPQASINHALEAFYAAREVVTSHQQRRDAVQQQLTTARDRLEHQLEQIRTEQAHTANPEHLRWEGEMIFAFLHTLSPGQTALEMEGQTIALDPERGPVECAQARFRRYHKLRSGRESLAERRRSTETQLAGLEQLAALLAVADEREQIEQIAIEAEEQGYLPAVPDKKARSKQRRFGRRKPLRLASSDGIDIYVGRSSSQNGDVTFRLGRPDDLWLHLRGLPGAHVIVRSGGGAVPERTLQEAAGLAAYFSPARAETSVEVDIAPRKHVRRVRGGPPGLVTYHAERTIRVPPLPPWG